MGDKENLISRLKKVGVVHRQQIKLKHAGNTSYYIDIKKAYGYPEIMDLLCKMVKEQIGKRMSCVAACGHGGIPLAVALSAKYNLKLILVREKPKNHGRNVQIDGYMPNEKDRVWIVDDVFTTGKSINQVINIIKSTEAKVAGCSVIVRRNSQKLTIPCKHLITAEDLI